MQQDQDKQFNLHMPQSLFEEIKFASSMFGISMNIFIVEILNTHIANFRPIIAEGKKLLERHKLITAAYSFGHNTETDFSESSEKTVEEKPLSKTYTKITPKLPDPFEQEIWKPMVGKWSMYRVSNLGRVKNSNGTIMTMFQPSERQGRSLRVNVCSKGKSSTVTVAKEVLKAFVGIPAGGETNIVYLDKDVTNLKLENLKWA